MPFFDTMVNSFLNAAKMFHLKWSIYLNNLEMICGPNPSIFPIRGLYSLFYVLNTPVCHR